MEPRQGVNAPAFATFVIGCLGLLAVVQGGGFLLLLSTGNAPPGVAVLLGAAVACFLGWLILAMHYLWSWRKDPSVGFSTGRKRWTVILLAATAVLLLLAVLPSAGM